MEDWFKTLANSRPVRAARDRVDSLPGPVKTAVKAGAIGVGVGAGVGGAVFVAPPLLGFTSAGVAAGSIAAAIQSAVYGAVVPAGSVFAALEAIGATGTMVPAVVAGVSAGVSAGGTAAVVGRGGGANTTNSGGEDGGNHNAVGDADGSEASRVEVGGEDAEPEIKEEAELQEGPIIEGVLPNNLATVRAVPLDGDQLVLIRNRTLDRSGGEPEIGQRRNSARMRV